MSTWTEFDPHTGITEHCFVDEINNTLTVTKTQDCTKVVDDLKEIKATRSADAAWTKNNFALHCSIPVGVQYELLSKHGVDILKRDHWPRLFYLIDTEYPYLKATDKKIGGGSRKVIVG
jgi:hypothetical protein